MPTRMATIKNNKKTVTMANEGKSAEKLGHPTWLMGLGNGGPSGKVWQFSYKLKHATSAVTAE